MGKDMRIFLKGKKQREMGGWNSPGTKTTQKNKKMAGYAIVSFS
jgi:hypothetical protein